MNDSGTDQWSLLTIGSVGGQSLYDRLPDGRLASQSGPATIWGVNADLESYSLLNCYTVQTTVHFGSLREGTERWQVGAIVEGSGVWVDSETLVDDITIEYRDLAEWAWDRTERGVEPTFTDDGIILTLSLIANIVEAHAQQHSVQLSWYRQAPLTDGPFTVEPRASLRIADKLKLADVAGKWVFPIGQLLSLLTLSHCSTTSIQARVVSERAKGYSKYVSVRFRQAAARTRVDETQQGPLARQLNMLVTRTALEERGTDLTALLSAFLKFQDNPKLRDALSHFLDSQARSEIDEVDDALRCLFNAFENFHAAQFKGSVEDEEELGAALKRLVAKTPRKYRDEVARRLGRKKQKSIERKLEDLLGICGETASRVLSLHPNFVKDGGVARNEIAHANPKSASRWKRHVVLVDLQWLMRHAFLQALGVRPSDCDDIFRQLGRPFSQYVGHQ